MLLCFSAFVITFVVTRSITRLIRAGRGPFKDNVTAAGLHVHHAVPGLVALAVGAFLSVGAGSNEPWASLAAVLIGSGLSLVLDEFALIVRLEDVYWAKEGRVSVRMVALAIACLGLVLTGFSPLAGELSTFGHVGLGAFAVAVVIHLGSIAICLAKGKYRTALFALFIPIVGVVGAVRKARPTSPWATRLYADHKLRKAACRAAKSDERWGGLWDRLADKVAGPITPASATTSEQTEP